MSELVEIGRIIKTHGLKGRLKSISFLGDDSLLERLEEVVVRDEKGHEKVYRIKNIQPSGKSFFLELEGVNDPDSAKGLVGSGIFIPFGLLDELSEGEYYWHQVIGLKAYTVDGDYVGTVSAIFPAGETEVYVLTGGEREVLLPAIEGVILNIDLDRGKITVNIPEGL